jgi:hypothetical protein
VKVDFSDRALREMQRIDASWRKRASSPDVFLDELERTIELIETTGLLGAIYDVKAKHPVRRLLMKKSEYHVYLVRKIRRLDSRGFHLECSPKTRPEAVAFSSSPLSKAHGNRFRELQRSGGALELLAQSGNGESVAVNDAEIRAHHWCD